MSTSNKHIPVNYKLPDVRFKQNKLLSKEAFINVNCHLLKQGVWVYFILLIFEGALRKWMLPGLATPLLLVRDPLALWIVVSIWQKGLLPANPYLIGVIIISIAGVFTSTLLGHGSITVALFGLRILLIHFPMMFAIGRLFNNEDVFKIGVVALWISVPMTVLIALQFYSPQTAWVNRGVGGDMSGAGFSGAEGYMRPPGTFSFTNGVALFYGFIAPFIFYYWFYSKRINRLVLISATIALIVAIPLSISRGLFFQIAVTMIFSFLIVIRKPKYTVKLIFACVGGVIALIALAQTSFFNIAIGAFTSRFDTANNVEGGFEGVLIDRYLGGMVGALTSNELIPFWGYGLGMGTNAGSMLLTGEKAFLIAEGEWGRLVGELGFLMGLCIIIIRLGFCLKLALASYQEMVNGNLLPWLLLSFGLLTIPQGQWAQPTALGFSTLIGGLLIASLRPVQINK